MEQTVIVILTALELEYAAVREHVTGRENHWSDKGTLFEVGKLASRPDRQVAIACLGMGNVNAAVLTERAINEFQPTALLFAGIAGGLRGWLALGDVVVAGRVYGIHGGKSEGDEFHARPRSWDIPHRIEQVAKLVSRNADWYRGRPEEAGAPHVHFEPIAAGEVVLNSQTSPLARQLKHHYNDAAAIEMESGGFSLAGHLNDNVQMATVRAVSDHADGEKASSDEEGWQPRAARNAAAFAVAVAAELDDKRGDEKDGRRAPRNSSASHFNPVVRDNARVGQIVDRHDGNNVFGTDFFGGIS